MNKVVMGNRDARSTRRALRGFTLIELMVVVAIVAILVAVAVPVYTEAVRKGRRGQAKADLVELAQIMERYRTVNNTYATAANPIPQSPKTGDAFYEIDIAEQSATAFELTATPVAGTGQADDRCGVLTINQLGEKYHSSGGETQCQFGELGP